MESPRTMSSSVEKSSRGGSFSQILADSSFHQHSTLGRWLPISSAAAPEPRSPAANAKLLAIKKQNQSWPGPLIDGSFAAPHAAAVAAVPAARRFCCA